MEEQINKLQLECQHYDRNGIRCGHRWIPRTDNPTACPKCKSYNWDKSKEEEVMFKVYWNDSNNVGWSVPFTLLDIKKDQVMRDADDGGPDYDSLFAIAATVEYTGPWDECYEEVVEREATGR